MEREHRAQRLEMLETRVKRIDGRIAALNALEKRFAWIRLLEVLAGGAFTLLAFQFAPGWPSWTALALSLAIFIWTVLRHNRIVRRIHLWDVYRGIVLTQIARLKIDWDRIPLAAENRASDAHAFERDLNLVGERSLHHLIDTAASPEGSRRLRAWLLNLDPDARLVERRQRLIHEMLPLSAFRGGLMLHGAAAFTKKDESFDGERLLAWLHRANVQSALGRLLALLAVFAGVNIALFVANAAGLLPPVWIATLAVYALVYQANYKKFSEVFDEASQLEGMLKRFRAVLIFLETYRYPKDSLLAEICAPFTNGLHRPSAYLRGVARIVSAASLKYNPPLWLFLNAFAPWDLFFAWRLEQQKRALVERLPKWLDGWYELEALHSLANFAFLNPEYTFPIVTGSAAADQPVFSACDLGHPLIAHAERVTNDFQVARVGQLGLITGSNMSGKSTFLRTVGINLCLAFAGAPVAASALTTIPFRLFTCINISDSLANGISYFYAEVRQLKQLLVALERDHPTPVFFLIDEIFRGTNNRERQAGSRAYVRALNGNHGTGLISTHDLELVTLADEMQGISLYHFRETVTSDRMVFEYRLQPGPSKTTNALKIMALEGLPVENEE
ncbi:MAG TPA: hypothetical protein VHO48_07675 [Anaerolineaceae bacterium]|nr:hypothetical protein [Anaerolineaceae bacterium]